jgi:hypothetical protein
MFTALILMLLLLFVWLLILYIVAKTVEGYKRRKEMRDKANNPE